MGETLHFATEIATGDCCSSGKELAGLFGHIVAMAKKAKRKVRYDHFLREWREYRELTQEELAAAMRPPTVASVISLLESGNRGLSNKWLERLAPVLRTKKGFILDVNPYDTSNSVLEIWNDIPESERSRAIGYLEALKGKKPEV